MATTITLAYGGTSITIAAPDWPEEWGPDLLQTRDRAMGGRVVSVTRGDGVLLSPVLHWSMLSEVDYNLLYGFIVNTVIGSTYPFTFTDWDAVPHTVRYMGGIEGAVLTAYDQWAVNLSLAVT